MPGAKGSFSNVANQFGENDHGISVHSRLPGLKDVSAQKFVTNRWAPDRKFTAGFAQPDFLSAIRNLVGMFF
jgi:hypothetical protein